MLVIFMERRDPDATHNDELSQRFLSFNWGNIDGVEKRVGIDTGWSESRGCRHLSTGCRRLRSGWYYIRVVDIDAGPSHACNDRVTSRVGVDSTEVPFGIVLAGWETRLEL